ncbi:MAG: hypothetical protein Kow0025_23670 [Thermodesulfovibrionales bacterium]
MLRLMSIALVFSAFSLLFFLSPAALAAQDTCLQCHGREGAVGYVDGERFAKSVHGRLGCSQCHRDAQVYPHGEVGKADCGDCHYTGELGAPQAPARSYAQSVHASLEGGPTCETCHGTHYVLSPSNPEARTYRANVPRLCFMCHVRTFRTYSESVHGSLLLGGKDLQSATCYDCHMEHAVPRTGEPRWKLWLIKECGHCHEDKLETYRDTYHGKVTDLGYATVAKCSDCHGSHFILPASDPRSRVSAKRIRKTCGQCHPYSNENFVKYYSHPDEHDKARYPVLFYTYWFMTALLVGVFSFFIVHTALWAYRSMRERGEKQDEEY